MHTDILSNLVITRVHSVSTLYSPEGARRKRSDRPRWAIVIKYEGETVYEANGKRLLSDLSHAVVLPRGSSYHWECTKAGHFTIIEFEASGTFPEPLSFPVKHGERILRQSKELEYKRSLHGPLYALEGIRDTYSILLAVAAASLEKYVPSSKRQRLLPALEYIHQNFDRRITNDILAEATGMSTVGFRKLFTEVMGLSPIAYARQFRIERAMEMLKSDYGTLSDLAQSLGYSSLYDFSRDFKRHTGVPPSKYDGP